MATSSHFEFEQMKLQALNHSLVVCTSQAISNRICGREFLLKREDTAGCVGVSRQPITTSSIIWFIFSEYVFEEINHLL
jgi:hypothetical protein